MEAHSKIRRIIIENLISYHKELNEGENELRFWMDTYREYFAKSNNSLKAIAWILEDDNYADNIKLKKIGLVLDKSKHIIFT